MTFNAFRILPLACLVLAGCRVEIDVPEGGRVRSSSGLFDCPAQTLCSDEITSAEFDETFTAIPSAGYRFVGWSQTESTVCEGEDQPCELSLLQLPPTLRRSVLASDSVARLVPVFEPSASLGSYDISGTIGVLSEATIDSDSNNPDNGYRSNDYPNEAQTVANPVTIGGYLNDAGVGYEGNTFDAGDIEDYFRIEARAGDVVTLFAADYVDADLDLWLFDETGEAEDFSAGTGQIEQLVIPYTGTWYVNPFLYSGASNYVLTIGVASGIQTQADPIPGEVLVDYAAEAVLRPDVSSDLRRQVSEKFALAEQGGDVARTRRLKAQSTRAFAGSLQNPKLQSKGAALANKPELKARWESWMLAKAVAREPGIAAASPNFRVQSRATVNDSFGDYLWHYDLINVPAAWDITTGSADVVVSVVDTGIIASHPDLSGQLLPGYDFISDASSAGDGDALDADPTDEGEGSNTFRSGNYHGLHVTGTIGATGNNNRGIAGVAYGSRVMPLRALDANGSGTTYDIMQAIRYAAGLSNDSNTQPTQTADVINLSVGGGGFSQIEQNLFNSVSQRGILVVAASGNEGASRVDYPASYSHVFAVGATDAQGEVTSYSNQGTALDLVAPGGRMEADTNSDGQPDGILSTYYADGAPEYSFLQGTSMATPHVAGVFALMKSVNPALDSSDVETMLRSGALTDDLGAPGRDNTYGWGLINARKAVANALSAAGGITDQPPQLSVSTSSLNLGSSVGTADVVLSNIGDGTLAITGATGSANWLTATPSNTDENDLGVWRIVADRTNLSPGSYNGSVEFSSTAGAVQVSVSLRVDDGSSGDIGTLYVLFIESASQEVVAQAITSAADDYQFSIPGLVAGQYEIWAGTDNNNDWFICDEGETCGAFPTMDSPVIIEVSSDRSNIDFSSDYQISLPNFTNSVSSSGQRVSPLKTRHLKRVK